jgi:hypothetical protein
MKNVLAVAVISIVLSGCAGKFEYTPPSPPTEIQNSVTIPIPKSKNDVWGMIIPKLGSSFFVINNLNKESGFINVSYSGDPEKYIDCGYIDSYVKNAAGENTYHFPAAAAYKEYSVMSNGIFANYKRKMDLDGRANIIVQEINEGESLVSINTKYVVTKDILVAGGYPANTHRLNSSISFNTSGSGTFPDGGTTCRPSGQFEREIIAAIEL